MLLLSCVPSMSVACNCSVVTTSTFPAQGRWVESHNDPGRAHAHTHTLRSISLTTPTSKPKSTGTSCKCCPFFFTASMRTCSAQLSRVYSCRACRVVCCIPFDPLFFFVLAGGFNGTWWCTRKTIRLPLRRLTWLIWRSHCVSYRQPLSPSCKHRTCQRRTRRTGRGRANGTHCHM